MTCRVCLHTPVLKGRWLYYRVCVCVCHKLYKEEMQVEEIHFRARIRGKLATCISIYVSYLQVSRRAAAVSLSAATVVLPWHFFPSRLPRSTGAERGGGEKGESAHDSSV